MSCSGLKHQLQVAWVYMLMLAGPQGNAFRTELTFDASLWLPGMMASQQGCHLP